MLSSETIKILSTADIPPLISFRDNLVIWLAWVMGDVVLIYLQIKLKV